MTGGARGGLPRLVTRRVICDFVLFGTSLPRTHVLENVTMTSGATRAGIVMSHWHVGPYHLDPRARESTQRPSASCGAGRRTRPSQGRSHHARCLLRCWSPWLLPSAALLLLPNCIFWKHCQSFKTGFRLQVLDSVMCSWLLVMTNPASLCSVVDSFVYMLCSAKVCWSITWQLSSATKRQSSTPHLNDFKIIYIFLTVINSCMSCVYKPLLLRPRECIANYSIAASNYHYWFGHTSWPFWYI